MPCLARKFLPHHREGRALTYSSVPILGLVDGDPYGLDILAVYKYGSKSMHHEKEKLAARRMKWLGLWASELAK
jgi:meiotic recombination protein SPO11